MMPALMSWRSILIAAGCVFTSASAQSRSLSEILAGTGIIPAGTQDVVAQFIFGAANTTSAGIREALARDGIEELKRTDPETFYAGRSPAVYPSPVNAGLGEWEDAYAKARALVAQMTDEEKNNVTIPGPSTRGCSGFTGTVERLGFPGICLNDGPAGVRIGVTDNNTLSSGFPAQLSVGASWNRGIAYSRSVEMGKEFKAKGVDVALSPVIGPIGRVAKGGRNWEGFGSDPYLAGALVGPAIAGLQESVVACAKHFIGNEQETQRQPFALDFLSGNDSYTVNGSVSSNIDDKTMHEVYLWPFYDAVYAGVGSVMCSYNRVNNSYGCQNSAMLNGLLKTELGFPGFVVSDWFAQHTGVASANAGLDLVMPLGIFWGNDTLTTAVQNGSMESSRLDDMATRILASWYKYSTVETPGVENHLTDDSISPGSAAIAFQAAVEGHVLVKNVNNALPLKKPHTLSLFGWNAPTGTSNDSAGQGYSTGGQVALSYTNGMNFSIIDYLQIIGSIAPVGTFYPEVAFNGTMIVGGGSGAALPASIADPFTSISRQANGDGTELHAVFTATMSPVVQRSSDACLVLVNAFASEGTDRNTLADEFTDTYVNAIADQCSNTIVVITNAGTRLVDRFIDHQNVTAVMFAHTPGQASGDALVEVLYGVQSPSGRLPYTVAHREEDYGNLLGPDPPTAEDPQFAQSNFSEGVFIDYRHFIKENITPRYSFGYGLTYSTFGYSDFSVEKIADANFSSLPPGSEATTPAPPGGLASLYDVLARASVMVKNTGSVAAAEVAQLYVNIPGSGVSRALRGFDKKLLQVGESAEYTFDLRRRDLSVWDVERQHWVLPKGSFEVVVGKSVLDIQGTATMEL